MVLVPILYGGRYLSSERSIKVADQKADRDKWSRFILDETIKGIFFACLALLVLCYSTIWYTVYDICYLSPLHHEIEHERAKGTQ